MLKKDWSYLGFYCGLYNQELFFVGHSHHNDEFTTFMRK
jgi:hypothetical protein